MSPKKHRAQCGSNLPQFNSGMLLDITTADSTPRFHTITPRHFILKPMTRNVMLEGWVKILIYSSYENGRDNHKHNLIHNRHLNEVITHWIYLVNCNYCSKTNRCWSLSKQPVMGYRFSVVRHRLSCVVKPYKVKVMYVLWQTQYVLFRWTCVEEKGKGWGFLPSLRVTREGRSKCHEQRKRDGVRRKTTKREEEIDGERRKLRLRKRRCEKEKVRNREEEEHKAIRGVGRERGSFNTWVISSKSFSNVGQKAHYSLTHDVHKT